MNRKQPDENKLPARPESQQAPQPFVEDVYLEFSGRKMISVPGDLVFDKTLNDGEKLFWQVLRHEYMDGNKHMPDQAYLAEKLDKSRTSIILYIKMLRATRWLSVSRGAHVGNLPTRHIYIIHEQQISFSEAIRLDNRYVDFILEEATQSKNRRLQQECCNITLQLIQENYPFSSEQIVSKRQVILEHDPSNVQKLDSDKAPAVQNLNSGGKLSTIKIQAESVPDVQNLNTDTASVVQILNSESTSDVQKLDSGDIPAVQNLDTEQKLAVQNLNNEEDIYNHARNAHAVDVHAHAPTQRRNIISCGNNINPTSNNRDGGTGGRDKNPFPWFTEQPLAALVAKIQSRYGKKTAHSVINRLKLGQYTWRDESFRYLSDAEDAAIVLFSLLDEEVKVPTAFVDALLYKAHKGELCWRGDQYQRYCDMTGQKATTSQPHSRSSQASLPAIPDGTVLVGISGQRYTVMNNAITPPNDLMLDDERFSAYLRAKRKDGFRSASAIIELSDIHIAITSGKVRLAEDDGGVQ